MGTNIVIPTPIEETHPQVGEMLKWWSNRKLRNRSILISLDTAHHVDHLCKSYLMSKGYTFPQFRQVTKTGRNEPCACGSGKKHKKCCGG